MIVTSLLLSSIASIALSLGGRTVEDCTIGEQWTNNFIRFECYKGADETVKGVRAVGCVPTKTDNGARIAPGSTSDAQYFTYSCTKSGDTVVYEIINCRDSEGNALAVGESRTLTDGSAWSCYRDATGVVKLAQEKKGGCIYEGKIYKHDQTWQQNHQFKATVDGKEILIGTAVRMKCKNRGAQGFVGVANGCVTATKSTIPNGGFDTVDSHRVKCVCAADGTATMLIASEKEVTCSYHGTSVRHADNFTTPDGVNHYYCHYGVFKKSGCLIQGQLYKSGYRNINGKRYYCKPGAGLVDFGDLAGCPLSNGTTVPFFSAWQVGTEVHRCTYVVKGNGVTASVHFYGCAYNSKAISAGKLAKNGSELKKCAKVGASFAMRDLTAEELAEYMKGGVKVYEGDEGFGSGKEITAEPSTEDGSTNEKPAPGVEGETEKPAASGAVKEEDSPIDEEKEEESGNAPTEERGTAEAPVTGEHDTEVTPVSDVTPIGEGVTPESPEIVSKVPEGTPSEEGVTPEGTSIENEEADVTNAESPVPGKIETTPDEDGTKDTPVVIEETPTTGLPQDDTEVTPAASGETTEAPVPDNDDNKVTPEEDENNYAKRVTPNAAEETKEILDGGCGCVCPDMVYTWTTLSPTCQARSSTALLKTIVKRMNLTIEDIRDIIDN